MDLAVTASASVTSATSVASGYPSATITAVGGTKTYLLFVLVSFYATNHIVAGPLSFQAVVDGSAPARQPTNHTIFNVAEINTHYQASFCISLQLTAGRYTFPLNWKTSSTVTFNINTFDYCCCMLIG